MAVRDDFAAGEVLAAADLNDTFAAKLDVASGKILQVVAYSAVSNVSTTSTSFVTTGISATITPSSASNKVLIMASNHFYTDNNLLIHTLFRGTVAGTNLSAGANGFGTNANYNGSIYTDVQSTLSAVYLDSPATTSAQTYTVGFKSNTTATATCNGTQTGSIVLMEVSA